MRDDLAQNMGVVDDQTGPVVIRGIGLALADAVEKGRVQHLRQDFSLILSRAKWTKTQGSTLPSAVDVQIAVPGDAAAHQRPVVPEIRQDHGKLRRISTSRFRAIDPLFRRRHEVHRRFFTDGNVVEIPADKATLVDPRNLHKFLAADQLVVLACRGGRKSEENAGLPQPAMAARIFWKLPGRAGRRFLFPSPPR